MRVNKLFVVALALALATFTATPALGEEMRAFPVYFDRSSDFPAAEAAALTQTCESVFEQVAVASDLNWRTDVRQGVQLPFASQPHLQESQSLHAAWWWTLPPSERTFRIAWIRSGAGEGGYAQGGIVEAGRADATLPLTAVANAGIVLTPEVQGSPEALASWRTILCGRAFHEFAHLWGITHQDGLDGNGNLVVPGYRKAYCDPVTGLGSITTNGCDLKLLELSGPGFGAPEACAVCWMHEQEEHYAQLLESHGVVVGTVEAVAPCEDGDILELAGGRFEAQACWRTSQGTSGTGQIPPGGQQFGVLWFFNQTNPELFVKVRNACVPPFNQWWVFVAGLTNVEVRLTVTDTLAGTRKTYHNPLGQAFVAVQDTNAFPCP